MAERTSGWVPVLSLCCSAAAVCAYGLTFPTFAAGQVFVVGEASAMAGISTEFTPTHLPLPDGHLSERGRRELIRDLVAEQGFAHRVLPMGPGLSLEANGPLYPGPDEYKKMIYEKGESSVPGDRIVVTALTFKSDRIIVDLNGGPYAKHRYLSHITFGDSPVVNTGPQATGSRVTLVFQHGVPEISAAEVKALLTPVLDFGAKTSADAYGDTLPAPIKDAIAAHDALVGMDRRMILASLGSPESKVREHSEGEAEGTHYEEWIYGHVPQTVKFVRFKGDRVVLVKIAALGKPIEIHDQNELGDFAPVVDSRQVAMGDGTSPGHVAPPTLREAGETLPADTANRANQVKYPPPPKPAPADPNPNQMFGATPAAR